MTDEYTAWKAAQAQPWATAVRRSRLHLVGVWQRLDEVRSVHDGMKAVRYDTERGGAMEHGDDATFALVQRFEEARARYDEAAAQWLAEVEDFDSCCAMLDGRYGTLLRLRYGSALDWTEVADRMGYTCNYCRDDLNTAALAAMYEVMPHRYRDRIEPAL